MTTLNFQIGQEVTFSNAYGVNVITGIKGNTATTIEKNTGFIYKKRLSSLKAYVQKEVYWNEQEIAQPIHEHGATVCSTLRGDGNGSRLVWDDVKRDCVTPEMLTQK
jgi:hypothetical protein